MEARFAAAMASSQTELVGIRSALLEIVKISGGVFCEFAAHDATCD